MAQSQQLNALKIVCDAVIESVEAAGAMGAPAGHLYAALMAHGCSLSQFESLMQGLINVGKLRKSGDLYFAVSTQQKRFSESDCSGSFDGFRVTSDADGGL